MMMKRGDIYFAKLDPTVGAEIMKTRPVLVVSNNASNKHAETVTVVPITSNVRRVYPFEVYLDQQASGLSRVSKAQCHQIRTISKLRLIKKLAGRADSRAMSQVNRALRLHLDN